MLSRFGIMLKNNQYYLVGNKVEPSNMYKNLQYLLKMAQLIEQIKQTLKPNLIKTTDLSLYILKALQKNKVIKTLKLIIKPQK